MVAAGILFVIVVPGLLVLRCIRSRSATRYAPITVDISPTPEVELSAGDADSRRRPERVVAGGVVTSAAGGSGRGQLRRDDVDDDAEFGEREVRSLGRTNTSTPITP